MFLKVLAKTNDTGLFHVPDLVREMDVRLSFAAQVKAFFISKRLSKLGGDLVVFSFGQTQ